MTIGFSHRIAVCGATLCAVGALALAPSPSAADAAPPAPASEASLMSPTAPAPAPDPAADGADTRVRPGAGAPAVPEVSALSWLVADADTGDVLAAHDPHRPLPPASTLKALFALTVLPALPGDARHTVDESELRDIGPGSSLVGVAEGLTYTVADLWRGVFLSSGNDAVHVLAAMNGGLAATTRRMQATARELGARDTHVVSPDGYDRPGQVSSAYDLAVFGRAGLHDADFARYCATPEAYFPGYGQPYGIQNTNRLLTGTDGVAPYPGLIGVKNGYTSGAGNTLIAAARRGGRTLVVTVLHPQAGGGFQVYEEARALLDWGFAAEGHVTAVGSLEPRHPTKTPPAPASAPARARPGPPARAHASAGPHWPTGVAVVCGAALSAATVLTLVLRAASRRRRGVTPGARRVR
ncbi:D-alanyl-D-alanine carboxypeptidase family protein [Streptomyces sp. B3I8]|uniref:D-alanyl-D-alanine carboxypeptidase family protein n=1 Tax=Streptomyces sp. B3I8 TaxID=3042303 RepID=UPI0027868109|nr:serine hydrolase [Streptomyces sp. B3I8]MDQ0785528.1 D-alanyl-D-alanine carboxypeptidase (penicillin-binding protein 5/6) [Streptomyces sp. B3I8]